MRVGILALQQEANTFMPDRTTLIHFEQDLLAEGDLVRERLAGTPHEIGGFFAGLADQDIEAVPLLAARALPFGVVAESAWAVLLHRLEAALDGAGPLDGLLVAPHGAMVSEPAADADGCWLAALRRRFPRPFPIIGTLDLHANLSAELAGACEALLAYRTNPHLDQFDRGREAAHLLGRTLRGEVRPVMAAAFPPLVINIEAQATAEEPCRSLFDLAAAMCRRAGVLSVSLLLGFPYADVPEMGAAVLAVTDGNPPLARQLAAELAGACWERRAELAGRLLSIEQALEQAGRQPGPVCLLDMGDNVGGGAPGDGTVLLHALARRQTAPAFVCLCDPGAVARAATAGKGARLRLRVGGKAGGHQGEPFEAEFTVRGLYEGRFTEPQTRHGGVTVFDQGRTAVLTGGGLTVMVTARRVAPYSL